MFSKWRTSKLLKLRRKIGRCATCATFFEKSKYRDMREWHTHVAHLCRGCGQGCVLHAYYYFLVFTGTVAHSPKSAACLAILVVRHFVRHSVFEVAQVAHLVFGGVPAPVLTCGQVLAVPVFRWLCCRQGCHCATG